MRAVLVLAVALVVTVAREEQGSATAPRTILDRTVGPGFTIALKRAIAGRLRQLKPGTYTIVVNDRSPIHNFHLVGPGVNKAASLVQTGRTRWRCGSGEAPTASVVTHRTIMHGCFAVG